MRRLLQIPLVVGLLVSFVDSAQAAPASRLEYAQKCAAEMGAIPAFNCLAGKVIPITVNGVPQSSPVPACDRPVQLGLASDGQCVPFSRLVRLATGNPNVETVAICRKYFATSGPTDPTFHDVAMVQHNKATGNTCFYQTNTGLPLNGTTVPSPQADSAAASAYWQERRDGGPGLGGGIGPGGVRCINCHDADPFMWSPYVAQVVDPEKNWNSKGKWNSDFQNMFGSPPSTFELNGNECVDCHRVGSSTCKNFALSFTTEPKQNATNSAQFWMPPNFSEDAGIWHSTFDTSMQQLARCCANPNLAECKTKTTVPTRAPPLAAVTAVSRAEDKIDLFVTDQNGVVVTAGWEPSFTDGWQGWYKLAGGLAQAGAPVLAASRSRDIVNAFVIGTDGRVYMAASERSITDGWQGWWNINRGAAAQGAPVTAISRGPDKLDVFVVGTDGHVYTAGWQPDFTDGWHGWLRIGDITLPQAAPVTAVSRGQDKLNIFATDVNGEIWFAGWEPSFSDGWHGWFKLKGGRAKPGAPVTTVSRGPDKLDVFVTGTDGHVYTLGWQPDGWRDWSRIGDITLPQGAPVHAVSRGLDKLNIFAADVNGDIWFAGWEPSFSDGWHGWFKLKGGSVTPGAPVTAVSRGQDKLDVFVVGRDGRIWTAKWEPAFTDGWHGWWAIGD